MTKKIKILLVEDNKADVELMTETMEVSKILCDLDVVYDGEQALKYLRQEGEYADATRPDLIFLDLNLPIISGYDVLDAIKQDDELKRIPVVILTSSSAEEDICATYKLYASAYVTKPVDLDGFSKIVQAIDDFWLTVVKYPKDK